MKKLIALSIIGTVVAGNTSLALASTGTQNVPITYNDIKIVVDGNTINSSAEPFIYNGVTYLPVRAVGEALGKEVNWDGNTNTVYIGVMTNTNTQAEQSNSSQEMYNANGIKVLYTGATKNQYGEICLNVIVENNSGKDIIIQTENVSLNDYMVNPLFSCTVTAGHKAIDSIDFGSWDLEPLGITETSQLRNAQFDILVIDAATYDMLDVKTVAFGK